MTCAVQTTRGTQQVKRERLYFSARGVSDLFYLYGRVIILELESQLDLLRLRVHFGGV